MITTFPRAQLGETIRSIEKMIMKKAKTFDMVDYVFIVDEDNVLHGVLPIEDVLATSNKDAKVDEVMKKDLVVVHPLTDQERAVYLALSHNLKAIPVVDEVEHLLGVVPYNTILSIFNEEVREDIFTFGGIFHRVGKEYTTIRSSTSVLIKRRLPWLIIGVLGGAITASIITSFEKVLGALLALAAFTPVLAYISDAAGTQSETFTVRSIALDPKLSLKPYFVREIKVALSISSTCALSISTVVLIGWNNSLLSLIVGLSMFLSLFAAILISTSLPFLFKKLDFDPAFASGPFATLISDIFSITIYFSVASLFLTHFGLI